MKRLLTFAVALAIAGVSYGQTKDYKHPFAEKKQKDVSEKFQTEKVQEASDYKHPNNNKSVQRVRLRSGNGANAAATTKHPLG